MTDEERLRRTATLLRRRRWAVRVSWTVVALCAGTVAVATVLALLGHGATPAAVATVAGWSAFLVALPAPVLTRDARLFERELAGLRRAAARRWPPELTALLEVVWDTESHGRVLWNARPIGAALHRPGVVRVTRFSERVRAGGIWFREVVPGLMPWARLRVDDHRYLVARRWMVDECGRAWTLPRAARVRRGESLAVELPGELGPIGAVAVLGLHAYPRERSDTPTVSHRAA